MKKRILLFIAITLFTALASVAADKKFTLVIDAGHGGHDAGAIGAISKEKNINLNVALAFGKYVESNCPDVKVIYTRKTDVFIPLHTRADIANKNKADLFVSIHTNSLPKGRIARGMETYTLGMHRANDNLDVAKRENSVILIEKDYKQHYEGFDPRSSESYIMFEFMQDKNMEQSVELAKMVQKRTCSAAGRANKGVKQAGFLVLRATSMPSCLIELGFISTSDEEQFLNSSEGIDRLGKGIYQAFVDYKKKYDSHGTAITYQPEKKQQAASTPAEVKPAAKPAATTPAEVKKPEKAADDNTPKKEDKQRKHRSRVAQELADAREGRVDVAPAESTKVAADVDSVVTADPKTAVLPEQQAAPPIAQQEAAKPKEPATAPKETAKPKEPVAPQETAKPKETAAKPKEPAAPKEVAKPKEQAKTSSDAPVFKVQILASTTQQSLNSEQLQGQQNVDMYQEGGFYKYTVGASTNYQEIYQLRKSLLDKFPEAFIIAFRGNQKMDVRQAVQEYRSRKAQK